MQPFLEGLKDKDNIKCVCLIVLWWLLCICLCYSTEITQDLASKGLGQVMEVCTPEQKNVLVSELVETLMTGKRSVVNYHDKLNLNIPTYTGFGWL